MLACVQNKCKDPCPGVCAPNAMCQVVNHLPSCNCPPGLTGNAYVNCIEKEEGIFYTHIENNKLIDVTVKLCATY